MNTLRVAFDDQIFLRQRRGGISRCFVELLKALAQVDGIVCSTPFKHVANEHLLAAFPGSFRALRVPLRWNAPVGARLSAASRAREGAPLVHHTFYDPRYLAMSRGALRISTVHDLIPESRPDLQQRAVHLSKERFVRESDLIICVSETTKRDLEAIYGDVAAMTRVVPHGVARRFFPPLAGVHPRTREPYVLFVGERGGYKNFQLLLRAMASLPKEPGRLSLLAVGGGPFTANERRSIQVLEIGHLVRQVSADDLQLPRLYQQAHLFVSPSAAEGFGLPVLEAMASGCPILLSDIPAYREIASEGVNWFVSEDLESLRDALMHAMVQPDRGAVARQRTAEAYTWERSARAMTRAYRDLVG